MKRPRWRRLADLASEPRIDPGFERVKRIAATVVSRIGSVLRKRSRATVQAPIRERWLAPLGAVRMWRCDSGGGVEVCCAVRSRDAAALLEAIIGGPAAATPTPLERTILAEAIVRLVEEPGLHWEEANCAVFGDAEVWRCAIDIESAGGLEASIDLLALAQVEPDRNPPQRIDPGRIPIRLHAIVEPAVTPIASILLWAPASVLPIGDHGAIRVRLLAGSTEVATGLLGACGDRRCVKITGR